MRVIGAIVRRNLRLFFRDRMNVFFSLLGALILFALYTLFLARLQIDALSETFPDADEADIRAFVDAWMFAGIVMLSTITTGLGALATLVDDGETGRFRDYLVAPVRRGQLVLGYLTSAITVAIVMSMLVLALSILYLGLVDSLWLDVDTVVRIAGITLLCCAAFTALSALIVTFIRTSAAFSGFATVIGTVLGFVAGATSPSARSPMGSRPLSTRSPSPRARCCCAASSPRRHRRRWSATGTNRPRRPRSSASSTGSTRTWAICSFPQRSRSSFSSRWRWGSPRCRRDASAPASADSSHPAPGAAAAQARLVEYEPS